MTTYPRRLTDGPRGELIDDACRALGGELAVEVEPLSFALDSRQRHLGGLAAMVPADREPEELLAWVVAA